MSVVGPTVVMFVVFLCSGFRLPFIPLLCFITVVLIICVSSVKHHSEKHMITNTFQNFPKKVIYIVISFGVFEDTDSGLVGDVTAGVWVICTSD